jgi:hypothetical protein
MGAAAHGRRRKLTVANRRNGTLSVPLGSESGNPRHGRVAKQERRMNGLIYLIGLIVVILAILSFFGLR